jgi:zinc D-Ala-D-Ala carboxypeptidase
MYNSNDRLSPHFKLREFEKSQIADRYEIDNTVKDEEVYNNLILLCENILEPIRNHYGVPFSPSSGYRCLKLNRKLGSSDKSQHTRGQACDIEIPTVSNYELGIWIRDNLDYDTVLLEFYKEDVPSSGWVHVSYVSEKKNRQRSLKFDGKEYTTL